MSHIYRVARTRLVERVAEGPMAAALEAGPLSSAERVHAVMAPLIADAPTEEFWVLLVDVRHRLICMERISIGTQSSSLVHPREVFTVAVGKRAAALLVVHNHPSGDPAPSVEDRALTRRLEEAGKLLGIPVVDHVVIGGADYVSLREGVLS